MKKFVVLTVALISSTPAFANDSAVAAIQVDKIQSRALPNNYEKPVFSFTGAEAQKLMKVLPGVATASLEPQRTQIANGYKTLAIKGTSANGKDSVINISCENITPVYNEATDQTRYVAKTPTCTINYFEGEGVNEGDTMEFNPFAIAKKILGIR